MHDLALDDVVVQGNYGIGIVKSVRKPGKNHGAKALVVFEDKQIGSKVTDVWILSDRSRMDPVRSINTVQYLSLINTPSSTY